MKNNLSTFWLTLGYICNNRCKNCYALPCDFNSKWMSLEYAKEIMVTMKNGGAKTCLLIGGEPTLYPHLNEMILFGHRIGLKMIIISNGRKFKNNSFTKQLFNSGLTRAIISLNGANEKTHNSLTCNARSFKETIDGIMNCRNIGKVSTLTTICQTTKNEIIEILELSHSLDSEEIILNCCIPIVSGDLLVNADECLDYYELASVVENVFEKSLKSGINFQLNATFPICLLKEDTLKKMLNMNWISIGCHMYRGKGVVFDPDGNILPCTHFGNAPLIGNQLQDNKNFVMKDTFWQFWNDMDSHAGKFRQALWRFPAEKCKECDKWGACIGGCPLFRSHFDPEKYINHVT